MTIGIYGIFDLDTDECLYVGQSIMVEKRIKRHASQLRKGDHRVKSFQECWDIPHLRCYYLLLESCENKDSIKNELEIKWFNILKPIHYGQKPSMGNTWSHSEKTKNAISESLKKSNRFTPCDLCGNNSYLENRYCKACSMERIRIVKKLSEAQLSEPSDDVIHDLIRIGFLRKVEKCVSDFMVIDDYHGSTRCSLTTITKIFTREGRLPRYSRHPMNKEERLYKRQEMLGRRAEKIEQRRETNKDRDLQICEDYESGQSLRELGKKNNTSHISIRNVLLENGVTLRAQGTPVPDKAPQTLLPKPCENCGEMFTPKKHQVRTCSKSCSYWVNPAHLSSKRVRDTR